MSCKCCAGPCRKKPVKRKGGAKKTAPKKQPNVVISLGQPTPMITPRLAISTPSSYFAPEPEKKKAELQVPRASGMKAIGREIETQTVETGGRPSRQEQAEMSISGMSLTDLRIAKDKRE